MIRTKSILTFFLVVLLVYNSHAQNKRAGRNTDDKSEYFEIPREFFNKPLLLINRITGYPNKLYHYGSSGMDVDYSVMLRFELDNEMGVKIIQEQYQNQVSDDDIIKTSVKKNHFDPVIACVPIVSVSKDYVKINVDFFKNDIMLFSPVSKRAIKKYELKPLKSNPVLINSCRLSQKSIQVLRTLNFTGEKSPEGHYTKYVSVEQLLTIRILPEKLMTRRKWDPRVGNFYLSNKTYSSDGYLIKKESFLERWKLEPEDTTAYFNGILTRPKNPIVFYMDENVPEKWRRYIKQGVLDWLPVFESIGFKDAIEVYDKPKDATWDDADPNYNMIRWVSSEIKDAQGNYVVDPRTGEVLNATLTWYQNYFSSVNTEYFVAAAAVDSAARKPFLPDTLFGEIMRGTMAHEMGHALGLGHNMIASSAYPTDSLRSRNFVKENTFSPSIMDYASYNYVAQPEDMPVSLIRTIGVYDYWAVEHAYKYVRPSNHKSKLEVAFSNEMINEKLKNANFHYMEQEWPETIDPTNFTGDLGDNPFLSGEYAIKNFKRIMPNIVEWSLPENGEPTILLERYNQLVRSTIGVFRSASLLIGGQVRRFDNSEYVVTTTDSKNAIEAMDFLSKHLFTDMTWLYNSQLEKISNEKLYQNNLEKIQSIIVKRLLRKSRLTRLVEYDIKHNALTTKNVLRKLSDALLKNSTLEKVPIAVQKLYVKTIKGTINDTKDNLILNHLLKVELDNIKETLKVKSQSEKNLLIKGFYIELSE